MNTQKMLESLIKDMDKRIAQHKNFTPVPKGRAKLDTTQQSVLDSVFRLEDLEDAPSEV